MCIRDSFPVRDQPGCACVVKVYSEQPGLKICDVVEFFGILSFEPEQAAFSNPENDPMHEEESLAAPPASLVPRLHCVVFEKLTPAAPLLSGVPAQLQLNTRAARDMTLGALTTVLGGDALAAEFTLLQLLSSVHARTPGFVLGKLSLNLTSKEFGWGPLSEVLQQILPRFVMIPLSIQNLCSAPFSPTKDYVTNRLRAGILQLSAGTHLMLDESSLQPGNLDQTGLLNMKALGLLLTQQQVEFDFQYHQTAMDVDLPTLVTSEGKTMLPVDCVLPVQSKWLSPTASPGPLDPCAADNMRAYLAQCRHSEFTVSETMSKALEQDFVATRQQNSSVTPETLNSWLQLARLVSGSFGQAELTPELWAYTRELERKRMARVSALSPTKTH
eukprot:TRINITY_DN11253_c0_g1_i5.p1 TRINITY_DN11253_c0_g1~~TRINITY_DN11253_c0_g1_i5.p1  ORF type:complete len:387 (-),score=78.92 TRINITY_DN11253_c0_g1_i5:40-1200(-)